MQEKYLGEEIPKLGFGLMRLPVDKKTGDLTEVKDMADRFIEAGYRYFDTAWGYMDGWSEEIFRHAVAERYPREKYLLATKFPIWAVEGEITPEKIFETQLARTGAEYFDFYLIHAVDSEKLEKLDKYDIWSFMREKKEKGYCRHIGFSFHDSPELLDELLNKHPEMEFVQLQINYADWENPSVQSRRCYETARAHGKSVIVMEPVKGGALASPPEAAAGVLRAEEPDLSLASWALRYCMSLDGLITVLSGMSSRAQMADNLNTAVNFRKLTDSDYAAVAKALSIMEGAETIPCTGCRYCVERCPQKIDIPAFFENYNNLKKFGPAPGTLGHYDFLYGDRGSGPKDCVRCGSCEEICPQHLKIRELLEKTEAAFAQAKKNA